MKRKTYHNFLVIRNKLMREKHYDCETATTLTHRIFDECLPANPCRTAEWFYDRILSKEEYEKEYAI